MIMYIKAGKVYMGQKRLILHDFVGPRTDP